ncbi:MAG: YqgE/AlgH family protein [Hyphomicrobiaceae bacterium]|nr:YqgE/AlgH family protein [Hyphomicrobiaceae bacterium]
MPATDRKLKKDRGDSLEGQLLLAMPTLTDENFNRSVVFMCAHSSDGAMGLIINRRAQDITFATLMEQIDFDDEGEDAMTEQLADVPVMLGGPVETNRGFVLHSGDYGSFGSTLQVRNGLGLTATVDILRAMRNGLGPARTLLALGYSGWSPGQLEAEIQSNGWLHCDADEALIFDTPVEDRYSLALARLGIDLSHLSVNAGHA